MNRDKINGYGAILRFITPVLITIMLFILGSLKGDIKDVRTDMRDVRSELKVVNVNFGNHLEHHKTLEVNLGERLKCLETIQQYIERKVR